MTDLQEMLTFWEDLRPESKIQQTAHRQRRTCNLIADGILIPGVVGVEGNPDRDEVPPLQAR